MLISAHYWDPKSPVLFEKENFQNLKNLKVIGDITCDINGSIPTTFKSTTIKNPYFYGEVSISRTARYFPATMIFKPFIILSAFFGC